MNNLTLSASYSSPHPTHKPRKPASFIRHRQKFICGKNRHNQACKEMDAETGLYYYGARYLDPKTSRWLGVDPAMREYVPVAPVNDEARKQNGNLPGIGGVFNYVNFHVYHYSANNPVKYVDPDGEWIIPVVVGFVVANMPSKEEHKNRNQNNITTERDGVTKITTLNQAIERGYTQLGIEKGEKNADKMATYHRQGTAESGQPKPSENQKWVLRDETGKGSSELIFDSNGNLVTDSVNQGTYNFVDADKSFIMHGIKDVLPYIIWGNDEVDAQTTSVWNRMHGNYKGALPE